MDCRNYQELIQKTSETLEKLKKQNAKIQDEINSREPNADINQIREKAQKNIKHLEESEDKLLNLRSKNFTFIELKSNDQKAFKDNIPKFFDKWDIKLQLDSISELDFQMKQMNTKRSLIQSTSEKVPTRKEFSDKISQNQNDFEAIIDQLQTVSDLKKSIFKRKLKKLINFSSNEEYQKIASKLNQIEDIKDKDTSKFGKLKAQAELLQTEFRLSVLRNSQPSVQGGTSDDDQINEQKELNQRIIRNGDKVRLYLLNIQAKNNAMNYAIKVRNDITKLKNEKLNKEKLILKYRHELRSQEDETFEIEKMLGITRDDDAVVEAVFTNILEKVKKLEEGIDGDLDTKINELRQKITLLNRQKRIQAQEPQVLTTSEENSQF